MLKTQVQTKQGLLQGSVVENELTGSYVSFKGIPYAKPPIGPLRFAPPAPPENWEGERDASKHANICLQKPLFGGGLRGSEDCLYLNVYTPNVEGKSNKLYPVMFYIHGGAFKNGSGDSDMYGPELLLTKDVILVTINYRSEVFGFLCLDIEEAPGNAGLKDQVAAMRWVKENIVSFGGDPGNITIFGESAGAVCVTYHLFSPSTKGLFHKAIAQSGVHMNSWAQTKDSVDRAFSIGRVLGINTTDRKELLDFLRNVPASELGNITPRIQTEEEKALMANILFGPVIEKTNFQNTAFISEPLEVLLSKGEFHDVPLVIGFNSGEGAMYISEVLKLSQSINEDIHPHLCSAMKLKLTAQQAEEVRNFYFGNSTFNKETMENMIHLRTEVMFSYHIYKFAKAFASKASSPVYFYNFDYCSDLNFVGKLNGIGNIKVVCHVDELSYIFQNMMNTNRIDFSSESGITVKRMLELWTNTAKFGNPTPTVNELLDVEWKPFEENSLYVYKIDQKLELVQNLLKERFDFWNEFFTKYQFE